MGKKIEREKYDEVKEMTGYCKSIDFVARKCGVSTATVNRIKRSKDYKDFSCWSKKEVENRTKKVIAERAGNQTVQDANPNQGVYVSYAQFKALAKDVDKIKATLDLILLGITELVDCWKEK